ncbi:MAG TPA: TIGR03960 family B12-binding radical SAM protein [candidate division Zixibacteria bacterium]|nr:TIGR03960 family B12-binding radical SAM protein [candidate division Zixibacteria bacterium]
MDTTFFSHVIKPGRYAGGEPGQIVKNPQGRVNYLHAFPDKYELGQSYLGLQTLYHVVNSDDRFLAERVFAPDHDAEDLMRKEGIPLFSLESHRPAREFDAIGFTITYELVYTNILNMLNLAGVPLHADQRSETDPIIMGGGPAVYNPEPLARFFDLFFIGDAEEGLPEMLAVLHEFKGRSREEKLRALAGIESVYVPGFYDEKLQPKHEGVPATVKARLMKQLRPEFYPPYPLVPLIETVHSHLGVEIMRGCPQGCRFCQAGPMYRPVRTRPIADIMNQIETQLRNTGYEEIALVSLSSSDYPQIEELVRTASKRLASRRVSVSFPALRPGSITPSMLDAISTVRKSGLTIAPEAGTERLRTFIRKDFPDSAIYDTVRIAFDKGWTTIKLYFMVGLPTETDEDVIGIANMVQKIFEIGREYPGRTTVNVTLSPFVPKPHTPFQWDAITQPDETLRKIHLIKHTCRTKGVNFKYHAAESAVLAGMLGRGGREVAEVIEAVYDCGCRFDGWSENFAPDIWFREFARKGITIESASRPIPFEAPLPWRFIRKGVSVEHLKAERQRTSMQLKEYIPKFDPNRKSDYVSEPQFGRTPRKVVRRDSTTAPTKNMLRLRWGKSPRYRYMSHLDNLRLIERCIRQAKMPVAYSQGFNPSMKLSFGPPLPLGFTSETEFTDITLESNLMPYMVENLQAAMPEGFDILEARAVFARSRSLSSALNRVRYTLNLDRLPDVSDWAERIKRVLEAETVNYERTRKEETKVVDIRPAIYDLKAENEQLIMVLGLGDGGYTRPTEVLSVLADKPESEISGLPFHRREMYHQSPDGQIVNAMDL